MKCTSLSRQSFLALVSGYLKEQIFLPWVTSAPSTRPRHLPLTHSSHGSESVKPNPLFEGTGRGRFFLVSAAFGRSMRSLLCLLLAIVAARTPSQFHPG